MSISLAKILAGLGASGVVGVGGYGIYSVVSQDSGKTIADVLKEEGKELLSFEASDNDAWDSNVEKFPTSNSQTIQLEGFSKEDGNQHKEKNRKNMKDACKKLSSTIFDDSKENAKEQVKTWCAKNKTPSS